MNLQETTQAAAQAAELSLSAIREAHRAACGDHPDALETLLLEALGDAVKLHRRLQLIAECAAGPRYAEADSDNLRMVCGRAASYLADLNGSEWINGDDAGSVDMRQRARGLQRLAFEASKT